MPGSVHERPLALNESDLLGPVQHKALTLKSCKCVVSTQCLTPYSADVGPGEATEVAAMKLKEANLPHNYVQASGSERSARAETVMPQD